jgi:diadenosine tetraphosphate (Ap4A) HIT family hydrolase
MAYDRDNVFARILRAEIPCQKVFENEHALAFRDIRPLTPQHVLVIPKGEYRTLHELAAQGTDAEIADWVRAVGAAAREAGVVESGYRVLANNGPDAHQEVPHLHMHVFGGRDLGGMIAKK